jgi:anti-sigma factor RsiW
MNEFSEELLSAYLDGELPLGERARVEQWLTESSSHRRMFDDLQAIRRELQALPQAKLDSGFSQRVLDSIRKRTSSTASPSATGVDERPGQSESAIVADGQGPTPKHVADAMGLAAWQWFAAGAVAALAVVLLVVTTMPGGMLHAPIALQDKAAKTPSAGDTEPAEYYSTGAAAPQSTEAMPAQTYRSTASTPSATKPAEEVKQIAKDQRSPATAQGEDREFPRADVIERSPSGKFGNAQGAGSAPRRSMATPAPSLQPAGPPMPSAESAEQDAPSLAAGATGPGEIPMRAMRSRVASNDEKKTSEGFIANLLAAAHESGGDDTLEVRIELQAESARVQLAQSLEKIVGLQLESDGDRNQRFAAPSSTVREAEGARTDPAKDESSRKSGDLRLSAGGYAQRTNVGVDAVEFTASPEHVRRWLASLDQKGAGRLLEARLVAANAEGETASGTPGKSIRAAASPPSNDAPRADTVPADSPPAATARPQLDLPATDAAATADAPKPAAEQGDKAEEAARKRDRAGYAGSSSERAKAAQSGSTSNRTRGGAAGGERLVRVRVLFVQPEAPAASSPAAEVKPGVR